MTILQHKDYQGSVEFDAGRLMIRVLHIEDTVMGECDRAADAQSVFEDLVDDYLETCAALGREPAKSFKGQFNVRIDPALHRRIAMSATVRNQSLNAWIIDAVNESLILSDTKRLDGEISRAFYSLRLLASLDTPNVLAVEDDEGRENLPSRLEGMAAQQITRSLSLERAIQIADVAQRVRH